MKVVPFILLLACVLAQTLNASEEHREGGKLPASVIANDPEQGFQLSDAAIARLKIRFQELRGAGPWEIPRTALVKVKRSVGVYRQVNGFLTFVVVELVSGNGPNARILSTDLQAGDRVAIEGGSFLRVIELDLSGGGGDSCG